MCCHLQPPQVPKCWQVISVRNFDSGRILNATASMKLFLAFITRKSTVSPGATGPSMKITLSSMRLIHFASEAKSSTKTFS